MSDTLNLYMEYPQIHMGYMWGIYGLYMALCGLWTTKPIWCRPDTQGAVDQAHEPGHNGRDQKGVGGDAAET
jgi:hypothetical protein